jgi:arginyl-tRNA synthetase
LEFDLQTLTNQDSSNPIFYINYAHARIHQLCAKSDISSAHLSDIKLEAQHQDVYDLLYESLLLNSVLQEAFLKRDMQKITDYLYSLASRVHKFYNEHRIIGNENELVYLKVLSMTALSIRTGLKLLGIQAKDVM